MMRFSIITPSYNMLDYLKRCVASVNDQGGVIKEHIIVDGGSDDGTAQWLVNHFTGGNFIIESDAGMYDAINKGIKTSKGDLIAYLNCDEQYLPNSLKIIQKYAENYPDAEVFHGNMLVIDDAGELKAYKKSHKARFNYMKYSSSYIYSCATFFRRSLFDDYQFNPGLRSLGDIDLYLKLLNARKKFIHVDEYLSVFTRTGKNLSSDAGYHHEYDLIPLSSFGKKSLAGTVFNLLKRIEKMRSGAYYQKFPLQYQIYKNTDEYGRATLEARKGYFRNEYIG